MKRIKFSARAKDGVIVIPKKYQKLIKNPVEVVLHYENSSQKIKSNTLRKNTDIDQFFNKFQVDLKGFKFNRHEAHER